MHEQAIARDSCPDSVIVTLVDFDGMTRLVQSSVESAFENQLACHGAMHTGFSVIGVGSR